MEEEDEDEEKELIITSKLQLRKLQYRSSPVISHQVSLSLLSSPDDLSHSRASVPFSWEEEPGKPKQYHSVLRAPPSYPKRLRLPPRLLLPNEFSRTPLALDRHHRMAGLRRWFWWKKDRDDADGRCSFVFWSENGNDTKITRTSSRLHCLSDIASCYLWEVPWKKKKLKRDEF